MLGGDLDQERLSAYPFLPRSRPGPGQQQVPPSFAKIPMVRSWVNPTFACRLFDLPHFTTEALRESKAITGPSDGCVGWVGVPHRHRPTSRLTQRTPSPCARRVLMLGYRGCACMTCVAPQEACWSTLAYLEQVADLLGHADVATTRRHYV